MHTRRFPVMIAYYLLGQNEKRPHNRGRFLFNLNFPNRSDQLRDNNPRETTDASPKHEGNDTVNVLSNKVSVNRLNAIISFESKVSTESLS